ncbi:MAG: 16S rRNA (uracil(1498)-N(3))-methyltransferase [Chitinophagales bacterium]|nr:16S rRNA (uracil(1498)-N(3))-methyltransferase [Chitinophagales bacterium]
MELYYAAATENNLVHLDNEESHHCIKVMRHRIGDLLTVTDGRGSKFSATILNDDRQACVLQKVQILQNVTKGNVGLHLAIAPTKNIDRFEWLLEKATEIGIDEITPIITHRAERTHIKMERLQKLLISAMKQSLRCWLPQLHEPVLFDHFINMEGKDATQNAAALKTICHCQRHDLPLLKQICMHKQEVLILVGPEGDFTMEEIALAESNGCIASSLGEARLRTETAGLIALHTVHLLND